MNAFRSLATMSLLAVAASPAGAGFDDDFTGRTMRLDLYHTGHGDHETVAVDRLLTEGPWPGRRVALAEDLGIGAYRFSITDASTGRLLFRQGFSTIFGEWKTTAEARSGTPRTFEEALRFPEPRASFTVRIDERDGDNRFRPLWSTELDPSHRSVHRATPAEGDLIIIAEHGPPSRKVDLLFLGDGYARAERSLFVDDVRRLSDALFEEEPYKTRRRDFNVRALFVPSAGSGVTHPRGRRFVHSPIGLSYNSLDSDRYLLTLRSRRWRDVASAAPYDYVVMLANDEKYGGGGILNLYCTASARSAEAAYLVIHEFGHHFAGLADEYYTSPVAYEEFQAVDVEPWEANATALLDPSRLKWRELATTGELPTPWPKERHDRASRELQKRRAELRASGAPEEALARLFQEERDTISALLEPQLGVVGAFEGAMYEARGLYRPAIDCLMFSRNDVGFCPVCVREIERVIASHAR